MGVVMELIILRNGEIPGFVVSVLAGGITYLVCSLVLGTFEKEDYQLLQSIKKVAPPFVKVSIDWACSTLSAFKTER
jgi:hypothetical protein